MLIQFTKEDAEGGMYLNEGEHECFISNVESKLSKKTNQPMLEMTFTSKSGKTTRDWFMLDGNKNKFFRLALALGFKEEDLFSKPIDHTAFRGKPVKVIRSLTGKEVWEGKERNKYENSYAPSSLPQNAQSTEDVPF